MSLYRTPFLFLEPLESRIAPAKIFLVGAPNTQGNDIDYNDSNTADDAVLINTGAGADDISIALGGDATTYYMKMAAGDSLRIYNSSNAFDEVIKIKSGSALIFFQDNDADNEVDSGEITGISLAANSALEMRDGIAGDVVTNYDPKGGFLGTGSISMTGLLSPKAGIKSLTFGSSIEGKIMAGGNITNILVLGGVNAVLAGNAANGEAFDFFPTKPGGDGVLTVVTASGQAGQSVTGVTADDIVDRIEAGGGGDGAAGGSISKIVLNDDYSGFTIKAGDGGNSGPTKPAGGKGGSISAVYVVGVPDPLNNTNESIAFVAGSGGNSAAAKGGDGGSLFNIFVGFDFVSNKPFPSAGILQDNVQLLGGGGGAGKTGGNGGSLSSITVNVATPDSLGVVNEIEAIAGAGGDATVVGATKAGAGGSISKVILSNQILSDEDADLLVEAGDGGLTAGTASGGIGGSITDAFLQSFNLVVLAGDGSSGKLGAAGGSLTKIVVDPGDGVITHNALFNAGNGGSSSSGAGAAGGKITTLTMENTDLVTIELNGGNGGDSTTARGGAGGAITGANIFDGDVGAGVFTGTFYVTPGDGGDGLKGGGAGGSLTKSGFDSFNMHSEVTSGDGGDVVGFGAVGKGGLAGLISDVQVTALGQIAAVDVDASIISGQGGDGAGTGTGGGGGEMKFVNLNTAGNVELRAGNGGSAVGAAAGGKGGSLYVAQAFGGSGTGLLVAGDAGVGAKAAAGGSITGKSPDLVSGVFSEFALTIQAGDGSGGGAGGSLKYVGYASTTSSLTPTPKGTIMITAGTGSASADSKVVGVGGSIDTLSGSVSWTNDTFILAGVGGGSALKSAKGGSITNLDLSRGGNAGGLLIIAAGDAGDTPSTSAGAAGGSIKGVSISDIDPGTNLRSIAAGDGGSSAGRGGLGGSLTDIRVADHDIGVRSGQTYGYNTMGGLFAGAGGTGATAGKAGNVSGVSAQAIAAIVAGRDAAPQLVEKVSSIYVGNFTPTTAFATDLLEGDDGDLDLAEVAGDPDYFAYILARYNAGNLVGAVMDPTAVDGNKFNFVDAGLMNGVYDLGEVPIDGLIAAKVFDQKTVNFTPEFYRGEGTFVAVETTAGNGATAEVQTLTIAGAPKFILAFGNSETAALSASASVTTIATALNKLPSIIAAGGVTVSSLVSNEFIVTFNQNGSRTMISSSIVHDFNNNYHYVPAP